MSETLAGPTKSLSPHLLDVPERHQAPAFAGRLDDLGLWVETLGEVLVAAALAAGTHLRVALVLQHAIQTLGLEPTRPLVRQLAVTFRDLGNVCGVDLNLTKGFVHLEGGTNTHLFIHLFCKGYHYINPKFIIYSFFNRGVNYSYVLTGLLGLCL